MVTPIRGICLLSLLIIGTSFVACSHDQNHRVPAWVMGISDTFPPQRYLLGVGEADSRQVAEDRAYGALAKVFQANVQSQADDTELYRVIEREGTTSDERTLSLRHSTTVTANKMIEQAAILDQWVHPERQNHYVLVGIDRQQAETGLLEKILVLDDTAEAEFLSARMKGKPLSRLGHFTRALEALAQRTRLNEDLRTVRETGTGVPPATPYSQVSREFRVFVERNLLVQVEVRGDQAPAMRTAIIDGLRKRGLPVLLDHPFADLSKNPNESSVPQQPNVVIQGQVHLWPIDVPDPLFTYVRWCGEFVIVDQISQRIIGVAGQSGREGHITEQEALTRASIAMQGAFTKTLASALSRAILNGGEEVSDPIAQACPSGQP